MANLVGKEMAKWKVANEVRVRCCTGPQVLRAEGGGWAGGECASGVEEV